MKKISFIYEDKTGEEIINLTYEVEDDKEDEEILKILLDFCKIELTFWDFQKLAEDYCRWLWSEGFITHNQLSSREFANDKMIEMILDTITKINKFDNGKRTFYLSTELS